MLRKWPLTTYIWNLFCFSLRCCPGDGNRDVDALSKRPYNPETPPEEWTQLTSERIQALWQGVDHWARGAAGAEAIVISVAEVPKYYYDCSPTKWLPTRMVHPHSFRYACLPMKRNNIRVDIFQLWYWLTTALSLMSLGTLCTWFTRVHVRERGPAASWPSV